MGKLKRLDYRIPDFLRTIWVSDEARYYWEPKIRRVAGSWKYVERASLTQMLRRGILQSISPEEIPEAQNWSLKSKIPMVVVGMEGAAQNYGNATIPYEADKPFNYRVYFGEDPQKFLDAWKAGDDYTIGQFLGFPECCTQFFVEHWKREGWRDLTYHTYEKQENPNLLYNNVMLRHSGVRGVFHLPCSVRCQLSVGLGQMIMEIMDYAGYPREVTWLKDLLGMPMRWSSLHGIAIVTTPIFRNIYASDPLPVNSVLDLLSEHYPEHGAAGNSFPFLRIHPVKFRSKPPFYNGFTSEEAMREAHNFILSVLPNVIGGGIKGKILDLGCGDGTLLREIQYRNPETELYGVDQDASHIKHGRLGIKYYQTRIDQFLVWQDFDVILIAIQRLHELPLPSAQQLLERIHGNTKELLIYSYDGWYPSTDELIDSLFELITVAHDPDRRFQAIHLKRKDLDGQDQRTTSDSDVTGAADSSEHAVSGAADDK